MRTGKLSVVRTPVDLREIVKRVTHAVQDEASQRGLTLHVAIPDAPVIIHADLTRIEQIVWNLISNALKFTSRGSVDVSLRVDEHAEAVLRVADTGNGIEAALLPHIFDMFRQSRESSVRRPGLGIGLALVKELVNLHGGVVQAESKGAGLGAAFTVTLPTHRVLADARSASRSPVESLQGLQVLMVDDDADTVETFKLLLEGEGAVVRTATSGEAALSTLDGHVPDVVLSDIGMPGMGGLAFVEKLREVPALKSVLCIALSGYAQDADVKQAQQAGFDAHLKSPCRLTT